MIKALKVLVVEDNESDVFILQRTLEKAGYKISCEVVDTPGGMRSALQRKKNWDVITSDHAMLNFNSIEALNLAKTLSPEVPFIILSGEIDINLAVTLMKNGAYDYIQKKEIALIIPAIERALSDVELRKNQKSMSLALSESDIRFKEVLENSLVASYKRNLKTNSYEYMSPVIEQINGYSPEEINSFPLDSIMALFHPEDIDQTNRFISDSLSDKNRSTFTVEYRFKHKLGHFVWLEDKYSVIRDAEETPISLIGSVSDITERKNMEKAIQAEKNNLETAQQIARIGSWEWDMVLNKVEWSKEMFRIYDIDPLAYDGSPETLLKVIHPDDLPIFTNSMNNNLSSGNSNSLDYRVVHTDGSIHVLHAEGKVEFDPSGTPIRSIGTVQDITQRKQAEEALRESEEKYKRLHESAGVGIGYYSPDGKVISYNNLAAQNMGGTPEDFARKSIYELFPRAAADLYMDRIQKAVFSDEIQVYEDKVDLPGDQKWFMSSFTRIVNPDNQVLGVQIISSDISKRKAMEESLSYSEGLFRTMFESSIAGICLVGLNGKFKQVNETFCKILGYSREEILEKRFIDITYSEDIERSEILLNQFLAGEQDSCNFEKRYVRKDNQVIWVSITISVIRAKDGGINYLVNFTQDITQRKKIEKDLVSSHAQINRILENLQDAYFQADLSGKMTIVNLAALRMFGFETIESMLNMPALNLYADARDRELLFVELQKGRPVLDFTCRGLRKDGSTFWASLNVQLLRDEEGSVIGTEGAVRDITERYEKNNEIKASELRYRNIFDTVPVAISIEDYRQVYDSLEELRNSGVSDLKEYMADHPEFSRNAAKSISVTEVNAESVKLYHATSASQLIKSLDKLFPEESYSAFENELTAIWERKAFFESDFINNTADGREIIVRVMIQFPETREGFINVLIKKTDITEQKLAEDKIRQLNLDLEQRVKDRTTQLEMVNNELESFSYSVSHDLRAPLRGIDGYSAALKENYIDKLDDNGIQYIDHVRNETYRMNQLIDDLLKLSHLTSTSIDYSAVNLSDLAQTILKRLQQEYQPLKTEFRIQPGLIAAGDHNLLEVVLTNLLENAYKYSSKVDKPVVQFGQEIVDDKAVFFVRDNGVGFSMDYVEKLFVPFQRFHKNLDFEGTGIGLATVKRIINKHKGRIWAEAKENQGATFYFSLPEVPSN